MGKEDTVKIIARISRDVRDRAKERTEHGEISRQIRNVVEALADGEEYAPDYAASGLSPEDYSELEGEDRPSDWSRRRKEVFLRDGYECRNCGSKGGPDGCVALHAHHIVPVKSGGNHYIKNLATLCEECHEAAHGVFVRA